MNCMQNIVHEHFCRKAKNINYYITNITKPLFSIYNHEELYRQAFVTLVIHGLYAVWHIDSSSKNYPELLYLPCV